MEDWEKLKAKARAGGAPADRSGFIEPLKARLIDVWASRPRLTPLWAYRWWWFKSWTMFFGSGIALWQGGLMLIRPSEPARLDDVMTMIPTLHAAVWKMVVRDIARPMELSKDARSYDYFGSFMEARPMQVPYEVTLTEQWALGHWCKPSKIPPRPRSAELDDVMFEEIGIYAKEPNVDEDVAENKTMKEAEWNFSPYTHEHLLTLKFYVHMLRDTVDYLYEDAGYEPGYSMQPYQWNHVTAVLSVPEPDSVAPYQLRSVSIYDRIHDSSIVWSQTDSDIRLVNLYQYDSWRWNPIAVPVAAPTLDYSEVTSRFMPRWATRRPDSKGLAYDAGWSMRFFQSWPPLTSDTLSRETGSQHDFRPQPGQYDDLYQRFKPESPLAAEQMAKVYKPSPTGKWAHEYTDLHDIK